MNLRGVYKMEILALIDTLHPELSDLCREICFHDGGKIYWQSVERELDALHRATDIPVISYLYHEKSKKGGNAR